MIDTTEPKIGLARPCRATALLALATFVLALAPTLDASAATDNVASAASQRRFAPVAVKTFHNARPDELIWAEEQDYDALLEALRGLAAHGLEPEHYRFAQLVALQEDPESRDRVATDAWFSAAAHMLYGKLDPVTVEPDWTAGPRRADLAVALENALARHEVASSLDALAPTQPSYDALVQELARVRASETEAPPVVPEGPALKQGMEGPRVAALQARLRQDGLLDDAAAAGRFDEATARAVRTFQASQGLSDDAIVGAATLAALNRGPEEQIEQLRVNLERWRWLPDELGRRHLRANIPGFEVTAWKDGEPVRTHLVIVGKPYRKTPVFSAQVQYIVFNPWWETPPSLARADKLPLFQRDPEAVERLGFQVLDGNGARVPASSIDWNQFSRTNFPFRIRQAPGDQNALGQVKIMFPNPHNVYLHDTPTRGLFAERQRAFSSGCLRTQHPIELAEWLLEETPTWDAARIAAAVAGKTETKATLSGPVPIHILYFTVVRESDGNLRYLDDLYDRDRAVTQGLRRAAPR